MTEFQPESVSGVSNANTDYIVIPALERDAMAPQGESPIGRIFIHQMKDPHGLGEYQPPPPKDANDQDGAVQAGTLHIELDPAQFKQADKLLMVGADERLPAMSWQLDKKNGIVTLLIGETKFVRRRRTDPRQLKTA